MKRMISLLLSVCFVVSLSTMNVSAAVPQSVQIVIGISTMASSKKGCSYVWNAKGPNTFDCSGLAYWCYKAAGVSIPRGRAYDQKITLADRGCLVSAGSRKVGYLIFYNYGTNAPELGIGHVSICMGAYSIIHASSSAGKVVSANYRSSSVVAVCRPCNWFY